jgi:mono/diheme cytochrome c family protein
MGLDTGLPRRIAARLWLVLLLSGCAAGKAADANVSGPNNLVTASPSMSEVAGAPPPTVPPLPTVDPDAVALGQGVYAAHCASCHGASLEGEPDWKIQNEDGPFRPPPHDASGHTWHHGDKTLEEAVKLGGARLPANIGGASNMPAFADVLTEGEITAVLTYIKSTWPEEVRALQWEATLRENRE